MKPLQNKLVSLTPLSQEETAVLAQKASDPALQALAEQALEGFRQAPAPSGKRSRPEPWAWHCCWRILRKQDGAELGHLAFLGPQVNGEVQLRAVISSQGQQTSTPGEKKDPLTLGLQLLLDWALGQDTVYFITSWSGGEKSFWGKLLEKSEFKPLSTGEQGQLWERERAASSWMSVYMCIGLAIGMTLGIGIFRVGGIGMYLAPAIGMMIGVWLDSNDKKLRQKLRQARGQQAAGQMEK